MRIIERKDQHCNLNLRYLQVYTSATVLVETRLYHPPVPLGIDKSAHDKQKEAICHLGHNLAGNQGEIPFCGLDKTTPRDSNAGQLQMMS